MYRIALHHNPLNRASARVGAAADELNLLPVWLRRVPMIRQVGGASISFFTNRFQMKDF